MYSLRDILYFMSRYARIKCKISRMIEYLENKAFLRNVLYINKNCRILIDVLNDTLN